MVRVRLHVRLWGTGDGFTDHVRNGFVDRPVPTGTSHNARGHVELFSTLIAPTRAIVLVDLRVLSREAILVKPAAIRDKIPQNQNL